MPSNTEDASANRSDVLWRHHTREEIKALPLADIVAVQPIGSLEQHGWHLPVDTDTRTATYVAERAALQAGVPTLVLPVIPYGFSLHHMAHGGTVTLRVQTLLDVLEDVCGSLRDQGIDHILILSGHGGNRAAITAAAQELSFRLGRQIEAFCWFDLIEPEIDAIMEGPIHDVGHAGEAETSAMLYLAPDEVRRELLRPVPGITDDPSLGTREKGERMLATAVEAVADRIRHLASLPGREVSGFVPTDEEQ
jgi:creatinine amidohydrolase